MVGRFFRILPPVSVASINQLRIQIFAASSAIASRQWHWIPRSTGWRFGRLGFGGVERFEHLRSFERLVNAGHQRWAMVRFGKYGAAASRLWMFGFFGQSSFHHYFESLQHSECIILIIQCQAGEKKRRQCPLFWVRTQATFTGSSRVFVQALHQEPILKYLENVSRAIPIKIAPAWPALPKSQKRVLK